MHAPSSSAWSARLGSARLATAPFIGAAVISALVPAPSFAATVKIEYALSLAGLPIGKATLAGDLTDTRYSMNLSGQLTGLVGVLSGGSSGAATASGAMGSTAPSSAGFAASARSSSATRTVQVAIASNAVTKIDIDPPFDFRPDRVPVGDADKRGIVDPLSAIIGSSVNRSNSLDPANCNRRLPIFDGTQRFDIVLSFAERRQVKKPGYAGEVIVCNVRYVPIAGHRPLRPLIKFMEENRDMSVWLAPIAGTRLIAPLRVSVATTVGTTVVEAETWGVQ